MIILQYCRTVGRLKSTSVGDPVDDPHEMDARVVDLRRQDNSFGFIAKRVGLSGAREAFEAFQRVLHNQQPRQRARLRAEELRRIERVATRLNARTDLTGAQHAEARRAIARWREAVRN